MEIDTLDELKIAFEEWRKTKKSRRDPTPKDLLERARRAVKMHGFTAVHKATRLERCRLIQQGGRSKKSSKAIPNVKIPEFSRIAAASMAVGRDHVVEVEAPSGFKLKVFSFTPETTEFLSLLCCAKVAP